ncbi:hypothetical protein C2R22_14725 [Salinigranum rubrum]|uniref:Uncharacterized protein n=1 Tax=Salinigranum rubrum TaxID=755307 RepID=A0A2I8VLD9_9EURY|nr:hypothetical protein C2R22_14725 [Salinigranum rubrum]
MDVSSSAEVDRTERPPRLRQYHSDDDGRDERSTRRDGASLRTSTTRHERVWRPWTTAVEHRSVDTARSSRLSFPCGRISVARWGKNPLIRE